MMVIWLEELCLETEDVCVCESERALYKLHASSEFIHHCRNTH